MAEPRLGDMVHYVSYGTPGGEYSAECRAALVTHAPENDAIGLVVFNPTGLFFHPAILPDFGDKRGGTWHYPGPGCRA